MSKDYIVTIIGYEGIDAIFGTYTREEALTKAIYLIDNAPGTQSKGPDDYSRFDKANELGASMPFRKDQVCIMTVQHEERMTCACSLLPEEYRNNRAWLY